jgi:hypothetical protein
MNESKEVSNGNSSLMNSNDKLATNTELDGGHHAETPVKRGNTEINDKPTTRKSFGDKSLRSSDKTSSSGGEEM